jgi:hypothetical protein
VNVVGHLGLAVGLYLRLVEALGDLQASLTMLPRTSRPYDSAVSGRRSKRETSFGNAPPVLGGGECVVVFFGIVRPLP